MEKKNKIKVFVAVSKFEEAGRSTPRDLPLLISHGTRCVRSIGTTFSRARHSEKERRNNCTHVLGERKTGHSGFREWNDRPTTLAHSRRQINRVPSGLSVHQSTPASADCLGEKRIVVAQIPIDTARLFFELPLCVNSEMKWEIFRCWLFRGWWNGNRVSFVQ